MSGWKQHKRQHVVIEISLDNKQYVHNKIWDDTENEDKIENSHHAMKGR